MKSIIEYLSNQKEEMPLWLKNYKTGDKVQFAELMKYRIGYYPGSEYDGNLIETANKAHCVHSYIYVDYRTRRVDLENILLQNDAIRGYHLIGNVEWNEKDLMPNGRFSYDYPLTLKKNPNEFVNKDETPYCFMSVFERNSTLDDSWGAERFAVTFLFADGIMTYYQLFARQYNCAPWLFLLQDHGFGCNYDKFGEGGILDDIITRSQIRPKFVICGNNTRIWNGYAKVSDVRSIIGGMNRNERSLFIDTISSDCNTALDR